MPTIVSKGSIDSGQTSEASKCDVRDWNSAVIDLSSRGARVQLDLPGLDSWEAQGEPT